MIRQVFGEESMSHTWKSEVKSILIFFCDIKGIVHKEFVLAGQEVNSTHCCDVLWRLHENVQRLHLEFWQQKNWLLHHDNVPSHTSFLTKEFMTESNITVIPHPLYSPNLTPCNSSLFPQLKI
jgi:hypothetical protein